MRAIPFHESGMQFTWSPASREVCLPNGSVVGHGAYTLERARELARNYLQKARGRQ